MESRNNNKDFEQFLKQNADQYRMFPSENVWKGIDKALHTRRRWYGLGLAMLLLLTGGGVTWVMMTTPTGKVQQTAQAKTATSQPASPTSNSGQLVTPAPHTRITTPALSVPQIYSYPARSVQDHDLPVTITTTVASTQQLGHLTEANLQSPADLKQDNSIAFNNTTAVTNHFVPSLMPTDLNIGLVLPVAMDNTVANAETESKQKESVELVSKKDETETLYPLTIESVVNSFEKPKLYRKVTFQVYVAPTVSYRKLSENKAFLRSAVSSGTVPASVAYRDVNTAVTHKPDAGLEIGVAAKYPITRNLYLKAGLQFNVSRYDIRAYNNPGEIATIALDAGTGTNSISQETIYRNYNGNRANWLQNLYYSASIPLGAEIRFPSRKATYFAIAATAQPTYIISDRAYLLSTDYKNYVEVPSLMRHWNFNTGFEALVGYSTGTLQWQIGPQVRYQVRSSFADQYPLKENLFDFGLKVGVQFDK
jgi:hypothetical protein